MWTRNQESPCHLQLQRKEFTDQERNQMQGKILGTQGLKYKLIEAGF